MSGGTCATSYSYDALHRQINTSAYNPSGYINHDLYYSKDWQMIEEKYPVSSCGYVCWCCCIFCYCSCSMTNADEQYVSGEGYLDDLVLRSIDMWERWLTPYPLTPYPSS
jgi:hypothetical protein